jgi:hypothetical protein
METKFNFNSQVCTSRSQSEKLLALGLKPETADMWYPHFAKTCPLPLVDETLASDDIPAWSLHRLLCLYGQDYEIKELYNSAEECYGMLITAIGRAIENEEFNEEYLNNGVYTH